MGHCQKPGRKFSCSTLGGKVSRTKGVLRSPAVRQFNYTFFQIAGADSNAHKPGCWKFPEQKQTHFQGCIGAAEEIGLGQFDEIEEVHKIASEVCFSRMSVRSSSTYPRKYHSLFGN